jgi:hypothetical protein
LFFDGLPNELVEPMTVALESIYDNLIERGTLPRPAHEPERRDEADNRQMTISELHPELVGRKPRPVLSCPGAPLGA